MPSHTESAVSDDAALENGAKAPPSGSVSVIVCAYTEARFAAMRHTVSAALAQLGPADEVLVVIDHNQGLFELAQASFSQATFVKASEAAAAHPRDERVTVLSNENAKGLSGARNAGVAAATRELTVFLDDDAVPQPGWLANLTTAFDDSKVIGVGGTAAPDWERGKPAWFPEEFLWVVGCSYRGLPQEDLEIRNPIGANMAFRHRTLIEAGGFTDGIGRVGRLPLGCEETEFSIRATRLTNGRIVQHSSAVVDHLVTADRARVRYFVRRCFAEGVSKAAISELVGSDSALSSERSYVLSALSTGVLRGLRDGFVGDASGLARAAAIIGGFAITVAGYLYGRRIGLSPSPENRRPGFKSRSRVRWVRSRIPGRSAPAGAQAAAEPASSFTPTWSGEIEINSPSLPERLTTAVGEPFAAARLLVRAAGTPVGFISIDTPDGVPDLDAAIARARLEFARQIERALADTAWTWARLPKISVVLCTHNRAAGVRRTLESLRVSHHKDIEILVIDNAPADQSTFDVVDELSALDPRIRYVLEPVKGLSRARNRGLCEATGEVIAYTDDDVQVDGLWLDGIMRGFARSTDVGCVTGLVATSSMEHPAEQYFDHRVWWSSSCEPRFYTRERGPLDSRLHPYAPGVIGTGANFACRVDALQSLGGFDECLGAGSPSRGGEDLDIFVRLLRGGYEISYEPSALVWHTHRVEDSQLRGQMFGYGLGLTAYLTKFAIAPETREEVARRAIGMIWHAAKLFQRSREASAQATTAGGLTGAELRGMGAGPRADRVGRRRQTPEHLSAVAP
jgi:glycosyltransferase involved in cell wall biosynthesis